MSKAANKAKTKWNAGKYRQVKVSVDPNVAVAFQAACEKNGVSMAGVLSTYMAQYSKTPAKESLPLGRDLSTKRRRRQALGSLIRQLENIRDAQECSKDNIPENLQNTSVYESAEDSIALMEEAIELLGGVY